jgi:PAS domain-containing protein
VLDTTGSPIRDVDNGEIIGGLLTLQNVTRWTHEIDQIKKMDEEKTKILDHIPSFVWSATTDGFCDYLNSPGVEFLGGSLDSDTPPPPPPPIHDYWETNVHPDDREEMVRKWNDSMENGVQFSHEHRRLRIDGQYQWMLTKATPFRNPETGKVDKWFGKLWSRLVSHASKLTLV